MSNLFNTQKLLNMYAGLVFVSLVVVVVFFSFLVVIGV